MTAYPKPQRKKSRPIIDDTVKKRDGVCLYGLAMNETCSAGLDPHHVMNKGLGGHDLPNNLITLCRGHHHQVHMGNIPRGKLRQILRQYHGYDYTEDELQEGV